MIKRKQYKKHLRGFKMKKNILIFIIISIITTISFIITFIYQIILSLQKFGLVLICIIPHWSLIFLVIGIIGYIFLVIIKNKFYGENNE